MRSDLPGGLTTTGLSPMFMNIQEIDVATLAQWKAENKEFVLIDCRTPGEMFQGMIEGGEPVPMNQIPYVVDELPKDKDIVVYCRTGARSAQVCSFLSSRGIANCFNLRGGIMDWARGGQPVAQPDPSMFQGA